MAFAGPLAALGIRLIAAAPRPDRGIADGQRAALDEAMANTRGPLLVGGISLGAHVAATWAAQRPHKTGDRLAGLLLALPAWTGCAGDAPAAVAARATGAQLRSGGLAAAVGAARAGAPRWLADELERSWRGYGPTLADALIAAAAEPGPEISALRTLDVPTGLSALVDDPVHPLAVAQQWHALLPHATLHTTTLATLGADPAVLGRATLLGWLRAATPADRTSEPKR